MHVRRGGLVVAAVGITLLGAALALAPPPKWLDDVQQREGEIPERLLARGPATAVRYDADADVTHAVFECAHWSCPHAVTIQGDARAEAATEGVLLVADAARPFATAPLDPPLTTRWNETVATTLEGAFRLAPRWPGAVGVAGGAALLLAGVALAFGLPGAALGALASVGVVTATLLADGGWIILAQVVGVPSAIVGGLVAVGFSDGKPRRRQLGLGLASYVPTLLLLVALRYFAYFPMDGP